MKMHKFVAIQLFAKLAFMQSLILIDVHILPGIRYKGGLNLPNAFWFWSAMNMLLQNIKKTMHDLDKRKKKC